MTCQDSLQASSPNEKLFAHVPEYEYDRIKLEGLMYQFWRPALIEAERSRIRQTWFDYRHIHPVLRSFVFVREYDLAFTRAHRRYFGDVSDPTRSIPRARPLYRRKARTIVRILNCMHLIDELGCPYDSYFDAAFDHMMQDRGYETYWRKSVEYFQGIELPPLVNLVDARSLISGQAMFERRNSYRLRLPEHPHYRAENWSGSANQRFCADWLIQTVRNREDRDWALARLVYEVGLLREHEIARALSLDAVKRVRAIRSQL